MPPRAVHVNGVRLFVELQGLQGAPLVLVHGSWGDHHSWDGVVPALARTCRVVTYDRRGHSQSERPATQGSLEEDAADLAALISSLGLAPAHVLGSSYGAAIVLKLAATRPQVFASMIVHEPPLLGVLDDESVLQAVRGRIDTVVDSLLAGQTESGARQFVETVALGPGMWETLSPEMRRTFVFNAPTWLDEMNDPSGAPAVDLARLAEFAHPVLITSGDQSPAFFSAILDRITASLRQCRRHVFQGAGHVPHLTHPDEFVRVVAGFLGEVAEGSGPGERTQKLPS